MEPEANYQALSDGCKRWERVTVSEDVRMQMNGETKAQMDHARTIKGAGGVSLAESFPPDCPEETRRDTSVDQHWPIDDSPCTKRADMYVLVTTALWLGVKLPILALPMILLHMPPMGIVRLYMSFLPDGTQAVNRSVKFYMLFFLTLLLALPAMLLAVISLLLDNIMYFFFCLLYCTFTCRWSQACASLEKIKPYRGGPSVILHGADIFVALIGQTSRQTIFETTYMVSCMWLLMPWLKYYVNCNPWVYDLGHRLCQQISTEMADLKGPDNVADKARYIISCTREDRETAERIDIWSFVPHYPFPPPDRRWALGLQAGGTRYPGKFTLVVHTTHASTEVHGSAEQYVLSNSAEQPIYRVMLWYSNPYHFLTGWVEASVSTGMPSQPDKHLGGEHPMWLVTSRSPQVAGRDSWTGSGMIDAFFDYWLPVFVHEMRTQVLGRKEADRKYQEVHSEDGISRPIKSKLGRAAYGGESAINDFEKEAVAQMKADAQPIGRKIAGLADTALGKRVASELQSADLHAPGASLEGWSSLTHAPHPKHFRSS